MERARFFSPSTPPPRAGAHAHLLHTSRAVLPKKLLGFFKCPQSSSCLMVLHFCICCKTRLSFDDILRLVGCFFEVPASAAGAAESKNSSNAKSNTDPTGHTQHGETTVITHFRCQYFDTGTSWALTWLFQIVQVQVTHKQPGASWHPTLSSSIQCIGQGGDLLEAPRRKDLGCKGNQNYVRKWCRKEKPRHDESKSSIQITSSQPLKLATHRSCRIVQLTIIITEDAHAPSSTF